MKWGNLRRMRGGSHLVYGRLGARGLVERFSIESGGVTIAGKVYSQGLSRVAPAIVLCHEFGLSMLSTSRYARLLCRHGWHVFVFDFPGSGVGKSRGRDSTQASVLTEVGDLGVVYDYVRSRPYVDKTRVILAGASQGGLVAALFAAGCGGAHGTAWDGDSQGADALGVAWDGDARGSARQKPEVSALVLYYPALNIPDDARRGNMLGRKIDPDRVPESFRVLGYVRLGPRYVRDARALDPWREIARYEGPVFICHGAKDDIVDIGYARKAAEVYPHARLVELPGARHVFAMPWTVHRAVRETVGFLKEAAKV